MMRFLVFGDSRFVLQREADFVESLQQDVLSEFIDLEVLA